jgi:flavin reductase (DIM6/NTAB) family NADH-FMN oxidoreductase RutF
MEALVSESVNRGISSPAKELDPRHLRRCFGHFATGVAVVTYRLNGEARGVTVNSFTSVSMDPPLVLVSIARSAKAAMSLGTGTFVINVLVANQLDLAMNFAGRPKTALVVPWVETEGSPRLGGCMAWFECVPWQTIDAGDHVLFIGQVITHDSRSDEALLFHCGQFRLAGQVLTEIPRIASLDGDPALRWLTTYHQAVDLSEEGVRTNNHSLASRDRNSSQNI